MAPKFDLQQFCETYNLDIITVSKELDVELPKVKEVETLEAAKKQLESNTDAYFKQFYFKKCLEFASSPKELIDIYRYLPGDDEDLYAETMNKLESASMEGVRIANLKELKKLHILLSDFSLSKVKAALYEKWMNLANSAKDLFELYNDVSSYGEEPFLSLQRKVLLKLARLHGYIPKK